jgi:hypothetical protein
MKKDSWVYRGYILSDGFPKLILMTPIGNIGKDDIPIL